MFPSLTGVLLYEAVRQRPINSSTDQLAVLRDFTGTYRRLMVASGSNLSGFLARIISANASGVHRGAAEEALILIAAQRAQEFQLLLGFHAFGDHLQAQAVRQRDDRVHDGRVLGIGDHILDEGAIDLELVEREAAQIVRGWNSRCRSRRWKCARRAGSAVRECSADAAALCMTALSVSSISR